MLVHWIWLATRPDLPDQLKFTLIRHFYDAEDVYYAAEDAFSEIEGMTKDAAVSLRDKNLIPAEEILRQCTDKGIRILTCRDASYPGRLKNIADPPLILYYKGYLPDFDGQPLIGVVGTRSASVYGLGTAKRMGAQIARCGGIVVSGLAYGVDGMAMSGALSAGGTVIGVLGCGADVVYPASNRSLFADTQANGCILSEFPPGTPPARWNFPKRNRIISGLSCGVLVVEAPERSGALITARLAAEQGRDVFVVPGNIDVDSCAGSNALLRDGAVAVSSGWDVMSEYEALFPGKISRQGNTVQVGKGSAAAKKSPRQAPGFARVAQNRKLPETGKEPAKAKLAVDKEEKSPYSDLNKKKITLTPDEQAVVDAMGKECCLVDDLIDRCGLRTGAVLAALTLLEVKGVIERLPGKRIRITGK